MSDHKGLSKVKTVTKNILTFGASGRVDKAVQELEDLCVTYEELHVRMEKRRVAANKTFEKLVDVKVKCVDSLRNVSKISKSLKGKDREQLYRKLGTEVEFITFDRVETTISAATMAMNLTGGVSTGASTALGAWALVSTFGTASTGATIGGLTGAAATNATLAWFGGGALAAGGGGMALGTVVLGGVVAVPALLVAGILSHIKAGKKINEIHKKAREVLSAIDAITGNIAKIDVLEKRSEELMDSLEKTRSTFDQQFSQVYKEIYPYGVWSRMWKGVRRNILRRSYFSKKDLPNMSYIVGIATDFATMIDTAVFDQEGA